MSAEHISVAGVVIAALFAVYGLAKYRGGGSRLDLLISLLIALGVVLVSVVPQLFEPVSRMMRSANSRMVSSCGLPMFTGSEVLLIIRR